MMKQSTKPRVPGSEADHRQSIEHALTFMDLSPDSLRWHYVQMVFKIHNRHVSDTARVLGVHRRTLQRILDKDRPKPKVVVAYE